MDLINLIIWYLRESGGDHWKFRKLLDTREQRLGQAFYNCLNEFDRRAISGSIYDTFYLDAHIAQSAHGIPRTLDFLTK